MADMWFTSDFHFGHFNIIRYCNRPFESTEEMDAHIADRMNAHVKQNDTLYFLGDFCMGSLEKVAAYRKRLNCKTIYFVEGNHDKVTRKSQSVFASWSSLSEIHVGKQGIVLCYYAMRVWPHSGRGAWQLYGHSHGNLPDDPLSLSMDVGVDSHGFCPWHFEQVQAIMKGKAIAERLRECGLELHPEKTKIVYCKDDLRKGRHSNEKFDFLGYEFRPRRSKNRKGKFFINFSTAVSNKAAKAMKDKIRSWNLPKRSDKAIEDLSCMFNPIIRGWLQYYGRYYRSAPYPTMRELDRDLAFWAKRKYKKLRHHLRRATHWIDSISRRSPELFAHWQMGSVAP